MTSSTARHRDWLEGTALFAVHVVSWPAVCAVIVIVLATLAYRLLAERERRKTLEATYRYAPPKTVVVLDDGPGGPPMRIWVGEGEPRQPPVISVHVPRQWPLPPRRRG
jgi:hypothetical protein